MRRFFSFLICSCWSCSTILNLAIFLSANDLVSSPIGLTNSTRPNAPIPMVVISSISSMLYCVNGTMPDVDSSSDSSSSGLFQSFKNINVLFVELAEDFLRFIAVKGHARTSGLE